jgi:uncharacterized protein DUF4389
MDHPIRLVVTDDLRRSRLTVFFRLLLAIPLFIWLMLYAIPAFFVQLFAWFAALFTKRVPQGAHDWLTYLLVIFAWIVAVILGRIPEGMRNLQAFSIRYHAQTQAYASLLTDRYPSFNVGLES